MTPIRRAAPNAKWVRMYRQGIATQMIAAAAGVAETTVRYHLAIAAKQDPGLRAEHQAALPAPPPRVTEAARRNLDEILAFYRAEGRLPGHRPTTAGIHPGWVADPAPGVGGRRHPLPCLRHGLGRHSWLAGLPNATGRGRDPMEDARGRGRRLAGRRQRLAPTPEDQRREEHAMGVWLHTQRIDYRAGKLTAAKEKQLNEVIPVWRQGRPRRGGNSRR